MIDQVHHHRPSPELRRIAGLTGGTTVRWAAGASVHLLYSSIKICLSALRCSGKRIVHEWATLAPNFLDEVANTAVEKPPVPQTFAAE